MEKIGEGYYYAVYALSPSRVVKRQTGVESKRAKLKAWYGNDQSLLLNKLSQLERSVSESIALSKTLAGIPELSDVLGNPLFVNDFEYEQDRAIPLGTVLDLDEAAFLTYVRQYADANILLWEFGYGEVVYNFTLNAGVSAVTQKVVLFDFNEMTRKKEGVTKGIETKKWTAQASMSSLQYSHPDLHAEVEILLESVFNLDRLNKHWGSRC